MPIKHNLTKYDIIKDRIHHVAMKPESEMTKEDIETRNMAIIIASFASNHAWRTYKFLNDGASNLNQQEVKSEYIEARSGRWKSITTSDISEVAQNSKINAAFSNWLFFNVEQQFHDAYKKAWSQLQREFEYDCDTVDKQ
ncbi:MAG: hypothetical protein QXN59_01330 [Candidatus Micrarchaeaceae archaeon]